MYRWLCVGMLYGFILGAICLKLAIIWNDRLLSGPTETQFLLLPDGRCFNPDDVIEQHSEIKATRMFA